MLWGSLSAVVLGAISAAAAGAPSNIPEDMVDKVRHTSTSRAHACRADRIRGTTSVPTRSTFLTSTATCRTDGELDWR